VTILQVLGLLVAIAAGATLWSFWKEYRNRANGPGDPRRNG
jgi:hypothetical protein